MPWEVLNGTAMVLAVLDPANTMPVTEFQIGLPNSVPG